MRVSTEDQHLGPEAQRSAIEIWAARAGVRVVAWYEDHGVSGAAPIDKRPGLLSSLAALSELGAGVLAVAKRDRLARDVVASAMIESLAARAGARVASSAGEGTDSDDPSSMLLRRMVDAFSEYERQIIKARTRAALAVKRGRSERVGTLPYGFQLSADGTHLEPCEAEQRVIGLVRQARAQGLSLRAIVAELDRAGIVGRAGKRLALTQVANIARSA